MRIVFILISILAMTGCMPPENTSTELNVTSFEGNWYGVRANGVTTQLSDSTFMDDGTVVVRFLTCLSSREQSAHTDHGTWSLDNTLLTMTLVTDTQEGNSPEKYTREYTVLTDELDRRTLHSKTSDYTFWLHRRWREQPYSCGSNKEEIERDRDAAIADGRFRAIYPDFSGS